MTNGKSRNTFCALVFAAAVAIVPAGRAQVPAAFVDIGYGARPMGMGGAFTAVSDDAHAIFWNPAGLTTLQAAELTVMHTRQLGLIPYTMLAYAMPIGLNAAGLGVLTSGNDVLQETTLLFSFARKLQLPGLGATALGLNFRYRTASFGNNSDGGENRSRGSASGYALELGALWRLGEQLRAGFFLRDLLNNMKYDNSARKVSYSEKVPTTLIFGLARKFGDRFVLAINWQPKMETGRPAKFHIGGELAPMRLIRLRAGMWQNLAADVNRNYGLGIGLNYVHKALTLRFDFAYLVNDLASSPRISFSLLH